METTHSSTVFISYAREDARYAERLYMDLRRAEVDAWLDTRCLLGGQKWKPEISRVIRGSAYFIALISQYSLTKRGVVQVEIKQALQVLAEVPSDQIFLIPVRVDECYPADEELQNLTWVDLFPNYEKGLERVLAVLKDLPKSPLEFRARDMQAGDRAPVHYAPYKSFVDFAKDLIERLPRSASFADPDYAMYVRYSTTAPGVVIPESQKERFPVEITIVLQHQFQTLTALREAFTVVLWFSGKPETLVVPYIAVREITVPSIGLRIEHFGLTAT